MCTFDEYCEYEYGIRFVKPSLYISERTWRKIQYEMRSKLLQYLRKRDVVCKFLANVMDQLRMRGEYDMISDLSHLYYYVDTENRYYNWMGDEEFQRLWEEHKATCPEHKE